MLKFIKTWTLPIAMLVGALAYFLYTATPAFNGTHAMALRMVSVMQPTLLFAMLLLTFCKVEPRDLRLSPWQLWCLALQVGTFLGLAALLVAMPASHWRIVVESAMLCMICPTATAAAVVTRKLGGNAGTLMSYTIAINLLVAVLIPAVVPLIHPQPGQGFLPALLLIMGKVFPLLLGPFVLSVIMRRLWPRLTAGLASQRDLPFYLWAVSLSLAIAMSVRSIVHTHCPFTYQLAIAVVSLLACVVQFAVGRWAGRHYGEPVTAAQACGQKNTVLIIWMGYTFMTPITSIAGGFYSVWHNVWNSYQLAHAHPTNEER